MTISSSAGIETEVPTLTPGPSSSLSKGVAMIISTMNDLPGYRIDEAFGEVFGLTVRSRNVALRSVRRSSHSLAESSRG